MNDTQSQPNNFKLALALTNKEVAALKNKEVVALKNKEIAIPTMLDAAPTIRCSSMRKEGADDVESNLAIPKKETN